MERAPPRAAGAVALSLPVAFAALVAISLLAASIAASKEVTRLRERINRRKRALRAPRRGAAAAMAPAVSARGLL